MAARVLIVEDEPIIAWDLRDRIAQWGLDLAGTFERGADAIAAFDRDGADLALLDIFLADSVSGIEVARHIRSRSPIPFIFITASRDKGTRELAMSEGPAATVSKPFDPEKLRAEVLRALGLGRAP